MARAGLRGLGRSPRLTILGVDAGGTKTDAIVCDVEGRVLAFATAGPGNWEEVGVDGMQEALDAAIAAALAGAGLDRSRVTASCYGLAGLDWPSDEQLLGSAIDELDVAGTRILVNDAFIALRAGCREQHGIASNCGTGTVTCGRNRAGETFRTMANGYGEPNGAGDFVIGALHAVAAAHHGTGPETELAERLVAAVGLASVLELFEAATRRSLELSGDLAPLVLEAAEAGDAAARAIVERLGSEMGCNVVGVARRLRMDDDTFELVRSGGVFSAGCVVLDSAFARAVAAGCPGASIVGLTAPPVVGAALYALEGMRSVDAALHDRLALEATHARSARAP